ncbi:B2 bradykinin receptor isoform X2 [Myxocyprinus asiaticus]|nr:B2 bradykinin receptor isoform X2 [Myxocyprinus asiaticus]XP_051501894.1 B2 bradykinin receptor isoform X2 [Myxocyprinus asiaticus]XP_051501896.1 B2 bradykinin receptor isoform X2 [Myxocyprinus asiaticus]XP_051501897.1 B2 bradykinin receptor isoform X2 [Myxocyprinus asiaticus]
MEQDIQVTTASGFPTISTVVSRNNLTNNTQCPHWEIWDWLYIMQPAYMFIICVLGIIGNVFVLLVFWLHKKACTVAEIYLGNLAAADLLLVSCLPFWAINIASGFNWQFGSLMCRLVNTGIRMNMFCSIYLLVLVSADRYVALVHAVSSGRMRRPRYAKLSCIMVWCFGLVLSIPTLHFRDTQYIAELNVTACILNYPSTEIGLGCDILLILLGFIIPLLVISYCTYQIIRALHEQVMDRFNAENTERKATILVLVVLSAFLLCWVPFHLVTLLDILMRFGAIGGCDVQSGLDVSNQIFTYLALSNSVLNPIFYVIVGKNFRKKVRELIKQVKQGRKDTSGSTRSQLSTLKTLTTY